MVARVTVAGTPAAEWPSLSRACEQDVLLAFRVASVDSGPSEELVGDSGSMAAEQETRWRQRGTSLETAGETKSRWRQREGSEEMGTSLETVGNSSAVQAKRQQRRVWRMGVELGVCFGEP
jgi:hypothetical protein